MRSWFISCVCLALFSACSSSDPAPVGTDAGKDSSPPKDSGGQPEAGPAVINGCADTDYKAANAISWNFTVAPNCVTVKVGDTVTWNGNFGTHPLDAFMGDTPNPIAGAGAAATGSSVAIKFTAPGTFGFHCNTHPSMLGAVRVTP